MSAGLSWSVTLSHELCEMLADPWINLSAEVDDGSGRPNKFYANEVCLASDTKIPLLSGSDPTIEELSRFTEQIAVYSISKNGHIRASLINPPRLTKRMAPVVRVTLDDGSFVRCTPEHRFLLRDGTYQEASSLLPGTSLMPLYRRREAMAGSGYDYEQVFHPGDSAWQYTHRMVLSRCPKNWVRHHVDFNRFNNDPRNLQLLTWDQHQLAHQNAIAVVQGLPQTKIAQSRNMRQINAEHKGQRRPELCVPHMMTADNRKRAGRRGAVVLTEYNQSDAHRAMAGITGRKVLRELWKNPVFVEKQNAIKSQRMSEYNRTAAHRAVLNEVFASESYKAMASKKAKRINHIRWHVNRSIFQQECDLCVVNNHKVVGVEPDGVSDVYDLTVPEYSNFAVGAGVFVHNCDAPEQDNFGYQINGVQVSDFVTPSWFEPSGVAPYDFQKHITAPFQILSGGYISLLDLSNLAAGWQQIQARGSGRHDVDINIRSDVRLAKRRKPRVEWKRSDR